MGSNAPVRLCAASPAVRERVRPPCGRPARQMEGFLVMQVVPKKEYVSRITVSLSSELLDELDSIVSEKKYGSRSQAVSEMLNARIIEHKRTQDDSVMVGTITLFYNRNVHGAQSKLADLQFGHIDEVISSLHVHLTHDRMIEVILVQGPASTLQSICDEMKSLKGVITGHLQLMAAIIPPLHPLPGDTKRRPPGKAGKSV